MAARHGLDTVFDHKRLRCIATKSYTFVSHPIRSRGFPDAELRRLKVEKIVKFWMRLRVTTAKRLQSFAWRTFSGRRTTICAPIGCLKTACQRSWRHRQLGLLPRTIREH